MHDKLTWTMQPAPSKSGGKVRLDYRYENDSDHVAYINDGAVQQIADSLWKRITVWGVEQPAPDMALIYVGAVKTRATVPPPRFFVRVEPGKAFEGSREVTFPLTISGYDGAQLPLKGSPTSVAFAIEVTDGEPAKWRELDTKDGPVSVPIAPVVRRVVADAKPMP